MFSSETTHICNECVTTCSNILQKEVKYEQQAEIQHQLPKPEKIVSFLDKHIIGQEDAKKKKSLGCSSLQPLQAYRKPYL